MKLTKKQKEALGLLSDGWEIITTPQGTFLVSKFGERLLVNRFVRDALVRKGLVQPSNEGTVIIAESGRTAIR